MKFIHFDQVNLVLAENQPEYIPLPVNFNPTDPTGPMLGCVQFSPEELNQLAENEGRFFVNQLTFGKHFQPIGIYLTPPEGLSELTKEELIEMLTKQAEEKAQAELLQKSLPVKLVTQSNGKILPEVANPGVIPGIVKDSISLEFDPELSKAGVSKLNLSIYVHNKDLVDIDIANFPGIIIAKI